MSLIQFFRILWARRLIILAATISCFAGGFIVLLVVPPRYEASSRVMLNLLKPDPVTREYIGSSSKVYVATQSELIKDYRVAGKVVDQLGWLSNPALIQQFRTKPANDNRDFRRWLAQRIIDGTKTKVVSGSNILEISFTSNSPNDANVIADAIRQAYIDYTLEARRLEATRNAEWYEAQAEKAKVQLDTAEEAKTAYERENGIVMQDDRNDLDTMRLRSLAGQTMTVAPMPFVPPPSAAASQVAQLDAQIAQASQTLGVNHPELQELRARRAAAASLAAQDLAAARVAAGSAAASASALNQEVQQQKTRVIAQRDKVEKLMQLASDVTLRRNFYQKTTAQAAEFRQQAAAADAGVSPMGSAVSPQSPSFPNKPLILAGSLGLGGGLGLFVALLVELLGRRVRGVEDLQVMSDVPLLAVIGPSRGLSRRARAGARPLPRGARGGKLVRA